jgi:hypothetical protein
MLKADSNGMSGRNKLAVSKLRSRLLEAHNIPGWKDYLRDMIVILRGLAILECEVRDIQASLLVGIVFSLLFSCSPIVDVIRSSSKSPTSANSCKTYTKTRRLSMGQYTHNIPVHASSINLSVCGRVHAECTAADYEV